MGVPVAGATAATVAVKVTLCDGADGFCEDVTVVVVFALTTLMRPLVPLIAALLVSVAVMVWLPMVFKVALKEPTPLVSVLLAGRTAAPSTGSGASC